MKLSNYLVWILFIALISCESSYEIKIVNRTRLQLDSLVVNDIILTIPPNSESHSFKVTCREIFFSEPHLRLWAKSYSDSSSIYSNDIGHVMSYSTLHETGVNLILVTKDNIPYYRSDIFDFKSTNDPEPK